MDADYAPPNALWASLRHGTASVARGLGAYGLLLKSQSLQAPGHAIARPFPGDAERGRALLSGSFGFGGETHRLEGSPWGKDHPTSHDAGSAWQTALHCFDWLDDVAVIDNAPAKRQARALVNDWITSQSGMSRAPIGALAWRGDVTARRVWAWAAHSRYLCDGAEPGFSGRLLESLGGQILHLTRVAGREDLGPGRATGLIGLAIASLVFEPFRRWQEPTVALLSRELSNAVLADGAHASRSPAVQFHCLADMIALRTLYRDVQEPLPACIQSAIDRMAPAMRFFRHADGGLAHFNGASEGKAEVIDTILSLSEARGRPPRRLPHGGYERISAGKLLLLADVGAAAPARYDGWMHAAPFAFEASWGPDRLIVNCGAALKGEGPWAAAQRSTAAHSTLALADTNASEIGPDGRFGARRAATTVTRNESEEAVWLDLEHDGYRDNLGTLYRRRLYVDLAGNDLRGEDSLEGAEGKPFAIRFHLHPKIQVSLLSNHSAALLRTPSGAGWRLRAAGADMTLSDSVYFAGQSIAADEVKRTQQIILTGVTGPEGATVKWALQRETKR